MKPIREVRRERLQELVDRPAAEGGGQAAVAARLGKDKNQVWQWLQPAEKSASRAISETTARAIERAFDLPEGWLDQAAQGPVQASQPVRLDPEKLADTTEVLQVILGRRGGRTLDLTKLSHAALFAEAYALRESLDSAPPAEFTASVIDLVARMEERNSGERTREQDGGDARGRARRAGAA